MKASAVLFCIMVTVVFSRAVCAAPKMGQFPVNGGDCAGCHGQKKVLPKAHPDTHAMNLEACRTCHTKDNMNLRGKLPESHRHQLANVNCEKCHGKTPKPEEPTMEQCVSCHGSTTKLAEKTKGVKPKNPHTSPHYGTELDCNLCHHQHAKSENYCAQCHNFDFKIP